MDKIDKLAWNAAIANDMTASTSTKERNTCRRAFGLLAASVMLGLNANAVLAHDTAAIEASFVTCAAEDERADGHCASYNADSIATTNAATTTRSADNGNITATADYYFASNGQNDGTDNASATGANATAIGANAMAQGDGSVVIGEGAQDGTEAVVDHAIVIGTNAKVDHESNIAATGTIAIGNAAYAYNDAAVALGQQAEAIGIFTTALGSAASATGTGAIAVGHQAVATGINAMAIGVHAEATNVATTAIGGGATANALYAVAIGYEASADQFNSVALGTRSTADRANAVSIGRTLSERQLIHVAAGTHGTDAVNVSQLTPTLDALGATFNDDGSVSAPSYNVGGSTVHTVGDALSNLDGRVTINTTDIEILKTQIGEGGIGLVQQDTSTGNITVAAATGGGSINFAGTDGERKLTGVANGAIDTNSVDAVNGSQLFETNQNVAANTVAINKLGGHIDTHATHISNLQKHAAGTVQYDDHVAKDRITLGGADARAGGTPVILTNLANGKELTDAVTIAQLKAAGVYDPVEDRILGALVYDDIALGTATLGGNGGTLIDNLKGGLIAAGSMQAVNGGQLYALQQDFQSKYDSLDGRVTIIEQGIGDGSIGGPGNGGGDSEYGPGPGTGDNSMVVGKGAEASGESGTAFGNNASASGNNSVALGAASVADRDNSVSVGSEGNERQITNVAAGAQRTDAANWGQVQDAVNDVRGWADQKFTQIDKRINRMGAMSAAYGQMAFSAQGLETKNRLGMGVGNQGGQSALAVGYSRQIKPNLNVSFGGSASEGDVSVGAGVAVGW